jgi:Lon protease (S16) C-terminal proteolytic domain
VLEESSRIALSWIRARAADMGLGEAAASQRVPGTPAGANPATAWDVHVHLPAGGVAKDGPSAGITLVRDDFFLAVLLCLNVSVSSSVCLAVRPSVCLPFPSVFLSVRLSTHALAILRAERYARRATRAAAASGTCMQVARRVLGA